MATDKPLTRDDQALMTATEGARELGVNPTTVWSWKARGLIQPRAYTASGHPLYSLYQLQDVEHKTRHSRGARRRK